MRLAPKPRFFQTASSGNPITQSFAPATAFDPSPRFASALKAHPLFKTRKIDPTPLTLTLDPSLTRPQEYKIDISEKSAEILGHDEHALYLALTSLQQIFAPPAANLPSYLEIHDWPEIANRGYMLDISRCKVPRQEALLALVDELACLKFTQLQLYTEHTFAYPGHKTVWENASPLTGQEIEALDAYCRDRYIELVPNQNSFGHMERWLRHDAYKRLAECPDGYQHPAGWRDHGGTLKPNQASLNFVSSLYDALLPHFTSKQFNVGCDETWEFGQGASEDECQKNGKHQVYLAHLTRIAANVERRGYRMMFWGDIILEQPELVAELPKSIVPIIWGYAADHPFEKESAVFKKSKLPFYIAPGTSTWNTLSGRSANARVQNQRAAQAASDYGAEGILLTDWGDNGHHQSHLFGKPSIRRIACLSWNLDTSEEEIFADTPTLRLLIKCGEIHEPLGPEIHNTTRLNKILFATPKTLTEAMEEVDAPMLQASSQRLADLQKEIGLHRCDLNPNDLQYIQLTFELLSYAIEKAYRFLNLEAVNTPQAFAQLQTLAQRFRTIWLLRNRSGGLDESVSNLLNPNSPQQN